MKSHSKCDWIDLESAAMFLGLLFISRARFISSVVKSSLLLLLILGFLLRCPFFFSLVFVALVNWLKTKTKYNNIRRTTLEYLLI